MSARTLARLMMAIGLAAACAPPSAIMASVPVELDWASWPGEVAAETPAPPPDAAAPRPEDFVGHLVATRAGQLVGHSLRRTAPGLPDDCTGLVRAAYAALRVDLLSRAERGDSGVSAMWRFAQEHQALEAWDPAHPVLPTFSPGDILFFHDTFDRNRDGHLNNDGLTHVAVVEEVLSDGTVVYVHRGGTGVSRGRLNLAQPTARSSSGGVLNDYLRPLSRRSQPVLGSELFSGVARIEQLTATGPLVR